MAIRPILSLFVFLLLVSGCERGKPIQAFKQHPQTDTLMIRDTLWLHDTVSVYGREDWQSSFNLTHDPEQDSVWGQPVIAYLSDPLCDALAFDFYYGNFKPSDNALTGELLELVFTESENLRPFYRWCLDKTIEIADGALAEYPGEPARKYAENFPLEFLEFMNASDSSTYEAWVEIIQFSGLHEYRYEADKAYQVTLERMNAHCPFCPDSAVVAFEKFVKDITKPTY